MTAMSTTPAMERHGSERYNDYTLSPVEDDHLEAMYSEEFEAPEGHHDIISSSESAPARGAYDFDETDDQDELDAAMHMSEPVDPTDKKYDKLKTQLDFLTMNIPLRMESNDQRDHTDRDGETEDSHEEDSSQRTTRELGASALRPVMGAGIVDRFRAKAAEIREKVSQRYLRVKTSLGQVGMAIMSRDLSHISEKLGERSQARKELREQKFAELKANPEDSRRERARKWMGRTAVTFFSLSGGFAIGYTTMMGMKGYSLGETFDHAFTDLGTSVHEPPRTVTQAEMPVSNQPFETAALATPTDIIMGGHTQGDPVASGYEQSLIDAGVTGKDTKKVYWSANMAPISGDTMAMTDSDQEGAGQLSRAIAEANGGPVRIISFSQGTEATLRELNAIAASRPDGRVPDNIHVILMGTPSGDLGLGKNRGVQMVGPVLDALKLETDQPIPPGANITVRTDIADVFGNGGNQSLLTTGAMAIGPGHRVVGPENGVLISTYKKNGVTYEIWGDKDGINNPITRTLRDQGWNITPEAEKLAESAMPFTMPGQPMQHPNGPTVVHNAGEAIDSYTGRTGIGTKFMDNIMKDPTNNKMANAVADATSIPDDLAAGNVPAAMAKTQNLLATTGQLLQNPQKGINSLIQAGADAAGIPSNFVPHLDETPAQAPAAAPAAANTGIPANIAPNYPATAPAAPAAGAPAPADPIQGVFGLANQLLGAIPR